MPLAAAGDPGLVAAVLELAPQTAVDRRDARLKAPKQAVRGNPVSVSSDITLVDGKYEPVKLVEEKLFIVSPDKKRKQIKSKEATGMDGSGQYANTFSFTPPEGVTEGNYTLESEVYVNERLAKKSSATLTLARDGNGYQLALSK
jgi:hypothetical protein